jgi:hypothetical protein
MRDVSIQFRNKDLIADRMTMIKDNVSHKSKIAKYSPGYWFRDEAKLRAPGTRAARGGFDIEYVNVTTEQYAFAKEITQEDLDSEGDFNAPPLNMVQDAIEYATDKVDLKKEKRVSQLIQDTTWADGVAGGEDAAGLWAPSANNTFLEDIRTGKAAIRDETGMIPNVLEIDYATMELLKEEDTILEKIKYTQRGVLTADLLAALIQVDEVIVGKAIENTAEEVDGADAFTAANVWETTAGKGAAFLFYRPQRLGLKTAAAIGQFRVKQQNGVGRLTRSWQEKAEDQWVYEVREDTDIALVHAKLGYHWINTAAAA